MPFTTTATITPLTKFTEYPTQLNLFMTEMTDYVNSYVYSDDIFQLVDGTDPTKIAKFQLSGITTGTTRTFTLPNADGVLASLANLAQTFAGSTTFSNAVTLSTATGAINLGTSLTTGVLTIGGTSQTSTITLGYSTKNNTINIGSGATENGATQTINLGTGGVAGSATNIIIGNSTAGSVNNITLYDQWMQTAIIGEQFYCVNTAIVLLDQIAAQKVMGKGVKLAGSSTYMIEGQFSVKKTAGTNSHFVGFQLSSDGTLTIDSMDVQVVSRFGTQLTDVEPVDNYGDITALATSLQLHAATTTAGVSTQVYFKGIVVVTVGGVLSPMITLSAVAGGSYTASKLNWMSVKRLGSSLTNSSKGTWV